ncbi:MAG: hypothetical protein ACW99Q_28190 [Candidatus Kariarchaeaceae archaeon]|jgi:hypothetical protein
MTAPLMTQGVAKYSSDFRKNDTIAWEITEINYDQLFATSTSFNMSLLQISSTITVKILQDMDNETIADPSSYFSVFIDGSELMSSTSGVSISGGVSHIQDNGDGTVDHIDTQFYFPLLFPLFIQRLDELMTVQQYYSDVWKFNVSETADTINLNWDRQASHEIIINKATGIVMSAFIEGTYYGQGTPYLKIRYIHIQRENSASKEMPFTNVLWLLIPLVNLKMQRRKL